jgi:hypothetical protein
MASILLVDDTALNIDLLESLCRHVGHTTRRAATVEAGLTLARAHRPDLIISDIHMAPLDGYDLLRTAKADPQLAPIPVILESTSARPWTLGPPSSFLCLRSLNSCWRKFRPAWVYQRHQIPLAMRTHRDVRRFCDRKAVSRNSLSTPITPIVSFLCLS